jgi:hypothetical protein
VFCSFTLEKLTSFQHINIWKDKTFMSVWRRLLVQRTFWSIQLQQGESPELTSQKRIRRLKFSLVIFPFLDPPKPTGYLAAMASGSMVRSDRPFKYVQRPVRTAWALEMEGYAFYRAVADHPGIRSLVVKGVCVMVQRECPFRD